MSSTKQVHGTGSIVALEKGKDGRKKARSKCRRWRLVVSLGRDPRYVPEKPAEDEQLPDGAKPKKPRYIQRARNFQGTYSEAQQELRKFIDEVEAGSVVPRKTWTYSQYVEHFVSTRIASGKFAERTMVAYRSTLNSLGRIIGNLKLQEITPQVLEAAYADLRTGSDVVKRPVGTRTLFNINRSAYILFMDAEKKGIIAANPLDLVDKPKKGTPLKRALPADKYRSLLAELDVTEMFGCAVFLCASLGLRRSESLALSWGDVSFAEETVAIHASLDDHRKLKEPKTDAGYRLLPLAKTVSEALMHRKEAQLREFAKYSPSFVVKADAEDAAKLAGIVEIDGEWYDLAPEAPLVCDPFGERPLPQRFTAWWRRHCKDYGLEGWTLHELRHSFLTAAATNGVHPAVMQQLAGHKSAQTTMEIYTHANMASKRNAVDVLQAAYM